MDDKQEVSVNKNDEIETSLSEITLNEVVAITNNIAVSNEDDNNNLVENDTQISSVTPSMDKDEVQRLENELLGESTGSGVDQNLIEIINSMEADRKKFLAHVKSKISTQDSEFEQVKAENKQLKQRVAELEQCLRQNNIDIVTNTLTASNSKTKKGKKAADEEQDILKQAKMLLFEKSKICKQQEQQLVELKTQVEATKEVLAITKDMLCIRNIENDHTQARFETMELKLKNERARQTLNDKKMETSQKMYTDLKAEYDIQSNIFKQLRMGYEEKINVLTRQIATLKS